MGGHLSLGGGGQYSLVNNVRGDIIHGGHFSLRHWLYMGYFYGTLVNTLDYGQHHSHTFAKSNLHEKVPTVKIWGYSKNDQNWTTGKLLKLIFTILHFLLVVVVVVLQFRPAYLNNQRELRNETLRTFSYLRNQKV